MEWWKDDVELVNDEWYCGWNATTTVVVVVVGPSYHQWTSPPPPHRILPSVVSTTIPNCHFGHCVVAVLTLRWRDNMGVAIVTKWVWWCPIYTYYILLLELATALKDWRCLPQKKKKHHTQGIGYLWDDELISWFEIQILSDSRRLGSYSEYILQLPCLFQYYINNQ